MVNRNLPDDCTEREIDENGGEYRCRICGQLADEFDTGAGEDSCLTCCNNDMWADAKRDFRIDDAMARGAK